MGTEYKLIDDEHQEFFELGKGLWHDFDPAAPVAPWVRDALEYADVDEEYLLEVIGKLEAYLEGRTLFLAVEIWNDDKRCDYTKAGTRYQEPG